MLRGLRNKQLYFCLSYNQNHNLNRLKLEYIILIDITEEGFTTFDLADIYGPAEEYVGAFKKAGKSKSIAKDCKVTIEYKI